MASNFDCIGLGVPDEDAYHRLISDLAEASVPVATLGDETVRRWQDPSGARLTLLVRGKTLLDFLPSFAAEPGVRLAGLTRVNDDVSRADVLDEDGEKATAMGVEVEERRVLAADPRPWSGLAAVTAFGQQVSIHPDEASFMASDDSLVDPSSKDEPAPPQYVEHGLVWPARMAAGSFISYGVFGPAEESEAYARLNGTVLRADRRRNQHTGQDFVVATVECIGFTVALCLSAAEHDVPAPGNIASGLVFLVASTGVTAPASPGGRLRRWRHR